MLPPVEPTTLAANPKFAALYHDLCTNKLNEDGTSRLDPKALKEQQAFGEELHRTRLETAKRRCVQQGLESLLNGSSELPDELLELIAITAAYVGGEIASEDRELVESELEGLKNNSKPIATALAKQLQEDARTLSEIYAPDDPPDVSDLPTIVAALQDDIIAESSQLARTRLALAHSISALHDLYREVIAASIQTLEQSLHGAVARGTRARAEYLAVVAEGMSKKLGVQHAQLMQQVYSPEIQEVLKAKAAAVGEEIVAVRQKVRRAEEELAEYTRVLGMEGMVKEYGEILRETERVEAEIARLRCR